MNRTDLTVIIRLACIEGYSGFKYRGFGQQRGSGQNGLGDWGGAQVWRRWGEHGVQVEEGECMGERESEQRVL